jgi:hypothetical protein
MYFKHITNKFTISRMVKALVFVPPDRLTEAVEIIIKHLDAHSKV